ncbi:MAG: ABC transporter substrate-binding protein, partial [Paracoccaceae bacterium]
MPPLFKLCRALVLSAAACLAIDAGRVAAQDFPITIEHTFGTTTIPERPVRVATVAWANHEVPLALGIVPVGFARANFGDDDGDGVLPWVTERLDQLGAELPPLFDEGDGIDFEAVAATDPDVILAAYSGLSQSDYDTLSRIAPVVAYRDGPWATDWREMIRLNSAGLGMTDEGEALVTRIEGQIAEVVAGFPEIKGKTAMFV